MWSFTTRRSTILPVLSWTCTDVVYLYVNTLNTPTTCTDVVCLYVTHCVPSWTCINVVYLYENNSVPSHKTYSYGLLICAPLYTLLRHVRVLFVYIWPTQYPPTTHTGMVCLYVIHSIPSFNMYRYDLFMCLTLYPPMTRTGIVYFTYKMHIVIKILQKA